jgi:hypothetical protein
MTNDKLSAVVASVPGVRKVAGMATHLIADETHPTPEWSATLTLVSDTIHTLCDAVDRLARENADLTAANLTLRKDMKRAMMARGDLGSENVGLRRERDEARAELTALRRTKLDLILDREKIVVQRDEARAERDRLAGVMGEIIPALKSCRCECSSGFKCSRCKGIEAAEAARKGGAP